MTAPITDDVVRDERVEGPPITELAGGRTGVVQTPIGALAIFAVAEALFAIDDACIRCGRSLCAGSVHRAIVTCAGCGWRYDIPTGQVKNVPALRAHVYDISIVEGRVMVSTTPAAWRPL
jgi:nitrite reductase/ring-hydroxylating ferredoxin subunit